MAFKQSVKDNSVVFLAFSGEVFAWDDQDFGIFLAPILVCKILHKHNSSTNWLLQILVAIMLGKRSEDLAFSVSLC